VLIAATFNVSLVSMFFHVKLIVSVHDDHSLKYGNYEQQYKLQTNAINEQCHNTVKLKYLKIDCSLFAYSTIHLQQVRLFHSYNSSLSLTII